jgi:protein-S-isoprenylcysteine O-methyltransferase Ste14
VLDTRIPPPVVTALLIGAVWWANRAGIGVSLIRLPSWLAALVLLVGVVLMLLAVVLMVRARTTVNPLHPERSRRLVTEGVFSVSRNPIYLGDALLIAAAGLFWSNWIALVALAVFVAYITRFQILPEETALNDAFGDVFQAYCARTRRWV